MRLYTPSASRPSDDRMPVNAPKILLISACGELFGGNKKTLSSEGKLIRNQITFSADSMIRPQSTRKGLQNTAGAIILYFSMS
jgi:hypothetical protein